MNQPTAVFRKQLGFWTLHCTLNALPSFGIALFYLQFWRDPVAIAAMLSAIGTFIFLYSIGTSLTPQLSQGQHVIARSIRLGAKIRGCISLLTLLVLPFGMGAMMATPDFWCGFYASTLVANLMTRIGGSPSLIEMNGTASFGEIFATTLIEGVILSAILWTISFFALVVLQMKARRKAFEPGGFAHTAGISGPPAEP